MDELTVLKVIRMITRILFFGFIGWLVLNLVFDERLRLVMVTLCEPLVYAVIFSLPLGLYLWSYYRIQDIESEQAHETKE